LLGRAHVVITGMRFAVAVLRIFTSSSRETLPLGVLDDQRDSPFLTCRSRWAGLIGFEKGSAPESLRLSEQEWRN